MAATQSERYTTVAMTLHWVIAAAIIGMIAGGMYMVNLTHTLETNRALIGAIGYEGPSAEELSAMGGQVEWLYQFHKSVGITILILTIARILWRVMNRPPALPADMKPLEKTASHLVHMGFYVIMLALPLTGWLYSSVSTKLDIPIVLFEVVSWPDIPFVDSLKTDEASGAIRTSHDLLGKLTILLLLLHVAGAVKHELSAEEGVLKRMIPGLFGKTAPPKAPSRGALTAFGSALGVFVLIAGAPVALSAASSTGAVTTEADFTPNWTVDYDQSSITFSGIHDGNPYTGSFGNWDAAIDFDPAAPESGRAQVTVNTGSATASQKLYTDSLKSPEWFNVPAFPTATVEIVDIAGVLDRAYVGTARLTLKDITVETEFQFVLDMDGETATMTGTTTYQRTPLDLGQSSDPGADWVAEDVTVDVIVVATRN
ncbi:MAG: cytochrome b/b6 domain-containing protein [Pseudomonadota bacterium]